MVQNHLKYNQDCSPLLHYRSAYRANSCGNAIAKPQALLHTGKERDSETGFSYFGARYYDSDILTGWLSVDPMADKYPSLSPYNYCAWNPVKLVDPDGNHIEVVSNNDGTYTVKNGQVNKDKNIYIIDKEGKRTGKVLGEMLTNYSFFDDNENVVTGAIIDTKDNSGKEFLEKVSQSDINLFEYVFNEKEGGRSDGKMDFKTNGITDNMTKKEKELYPYRGMPLGGCLGIEKKNVYGSARDVGNYAAGYMAGSRGLSWMVTRIGFDGYNMLSNECFQVEKKVSTVPQKMGYDYGFATKGIFRILNVRN